MNTAQRIAFLLIPTMLIAGCSSNRVKYDELLDQLANLDK